MTNQRQVSASEFEAKCSNPEGKVTPEMLIALLENHFDIHFQVEIHVQTDVYYDTPRFRLGGSGLSLRVRSIPSTGKYEVTAKRNISEIEGIFVREEVPFELPNNQDVEALINVKDPTIPPLILIRKYIDEDLIPLVIVENQRRTFSTKVEGSKLKVCHDTVTFSMMHANNSARDHEIEIELKSLDSQLMERIVGIVRKQFPELRGQRDDKYRRAIALLVGDLEYRSLSYIPPKFQIVTQDEIKRCLACCPQHYQSLLLRMINVSLPRLAFKSQLSVLPMPSDISLALWQERVVANLIETNPFLYDDNHVLADSCFIAVDLPNSPLRFFEHTRAQHSLDVCQLAMRLAQKSGLSPEEIAYLGYAGIRHDIGHPALCHSGEVVAQEAGGLDHEERALQIVEAEDPEHLSLYDMRVDTLKAILEEKGTGQILGLADTLAYLIRDGKACEHPINPGIPATILEHFAFDRDSGMILFDDNLIHATQSMLNFRFEMYRRVYYHPYSRIEEEMQQAAIRWALQHNVINLQDLVEGNDPELLSKMAEMAGFEPQLKQLVAGFFPDYCAVYHYRPHLTEEGIKDTKRLTDRLIQAGFNPLDFIVSLPDTHASRKTVRGLRRDNGQAVEIRAQNVTNFHPYDSRTIIAFSPRLRQEEILRTFISSR